MSAAVPSSEIRFKPAVPIREGRRGILHRLRRSRNPRQGQVMTACFGRLTAKDEMVVKGLAASLARSNERWLG
jgi:hypothetical protein